MDAFWAIIEGLSPEERQRFAVFVSASSRMPLKGWSDFHMQASDDAARSER